MKAMRFWGTVVAVGLGCVIATSSGDALAQRKKKEAPAAPVVAAEPPMTKKPIALPLEGIAWGQSPKQVAAAIDKILDADYKPIYQKTSPGVKMKALDAQLEEDKSAFRRSRIDFGKLPTGIDSTPLKGEYTYMNKESLLTLTRKGQKTHFFFIQEKLWKVISEISLGDDSPYGKSFQEAVVKFVSPKLFGVPGRVLDVDYAKGRNAVEVDWKDASTHIRVIQRSDTALALAYEDLGTLGNLASLRSNKPVVDDGIDPEVKAAIRGPDKDPGPPPAPVEKAGNKKK